MKTLLALFSAIMILCPLAMSGREYEPTLVNGRTWIISTQVLTGYDEWHLPKYANTRGYIEIKKDTIVNNVLCKSMSYRIERDSLEATFLAKEDLINGKLYSNLYSGNILYPTYDFGLTVGGEIDTFIYDGELFVNYNYKACVTKDELIRVRGKEWRRLETSIGYWVEGIGTLSVLEQLTNFIQSGPGPSSSLLEVRQDGEVIFTAEDFNAEPCGINDIVVETETDGPIYDTMGRRVETTQPGHLYIRNGRKFIARP